MCFDGFRALFGEGRTGRVFLEQQSPLLPPATIQSGEGLKLSYRKSEACFECCWKVFKNSTVSRADVMLPIATNRR